MPFVQRNIRKSDMRFRNGWIIGLSTFEDGQQVGRKRPGVGVSF